MSTLVTDPALSARLIAQRRARGADHHDEIWEGVYIMTPLPNNEHQELVAHLTAALVEVVDNERLGTTYPGVNLTDREEHWEDNYRCPDVVVFLHGNAAQDCGTHWRGGPDLVIEIVSPYDRTREKLDFYEAVGARELLIIDRDPWQLDLLRLTGGKLLSIGVSTLEQPSPLVSETTALTFHLVG
jgi:Uma2 family endonuclease